MQAILDFFTGTLNDIAWLYILLPCVAIGGVIFTIRNRGVQFTKLGASLKQAMGKSARSGKDKKGSVSAVQALTTALAATVGTGNILGTCQAIAMGGYGAIFWLWIAALLGMVIKYAEVVLAVHYRERNEKGDWVGGPMYYIVNGMGKGWKWLAVLFTLFAVLASFGIGNFSQINSITDSFNGAVTAFSPETAKSYGDIIALVVGILLAVITAFALLGGIKRIGKITELMIPFMSILYIVFALVVIGKNYANIGGAFGKIFSAAFSSKAVLGAASGIAVKEAIVWGLRRSAFSNEAGLGSAGIAHAAAETDSAVKQGLYGIFEVFADTLVICTLTGLTVIVSGANVNFGEKPGSELITAAFSTVFGNKFAALLQFP